MGACAREKRDLILPGHTEFKSGAEWNGNRLGRPKGSRHKLAEDFVRELQKDFNEHGIEAIQKCRTADAAQYLKIITYVLPKDITLRVDPIDEMTDAELIERINQLGDAVNAAIGGTCQSASEITQADGGAQSGTIRTH